MQYTTNEQLRQWREHLHQFPEVSLKEFETTQYIREQLSLMGFTYHSPMETATVVFLDNHCQQTVLLRADIDALPIQEATNLSFQSKHDGVMHACGHDGHITMLLGALNELSNLSKQNQLSVNVLAVFQPSEESYGGANLLINAFDFSQYNIIAGYALHVNPDYNEGVFASRIGEIMACCNEFKINITGQSAHVGLRHLGTNAMNAAAQVFQQLQTIPSYDLDDQHTNIVHVGVLKSGDAMNIVPHTGYLEGTIRTYNMDDLEKIKQRMDNICQGVALATNTQISLHFEMGYPPVLNNAILMPIAQKAAHNSQATFTMQEKPYLLGEDFSFYAQICPINYTFLGIRNEYLGFTSGLHTPTLQFQTNTLAYGVDYFVNIILLHGKQQ